MIKEAIGVGETYEEAKEDAVRQLNARVEDDIQFEVLATPKKKILGLFGGRKAKVKAFIELPDEKPKKANKKRNEKSDSKNESKAQSAKKSDKPKSAQKAEPKAESKSEPITDDFGDAVDESALEPDSRPAKAVAYLRKILEQFDCKDITVKVAERGNCAHIMLEGEGLGVIIGRRGEVLDALQYLTGLAANGAGGYYKVSLNIGDYRERRAEALTSLAVRISEQVLRTGKSRTLEPMNPYERRIIHTAVQGIDGVVSDSYGEGSGRRVIIHTEGSEARPPRRDSGRGRNGRDRNRRPDNKVEAPVREPKKDSDTPLYGKIN